MVTLILGRSHLFDGDASAFLETGNITHKRGEPASRYLELAGPKLEGVAFCCAQVPNIAQSGAHSCIAAPRCSAKAKWATQRRRAHYQRQDAATSNSLILWSNPFNVRLP
jgi:hypothetical protein